MTTRTIGGLAFATAAASTHQTPGLVVGTIALIICSTVPELFWLIAQHRTERGLRWVLSHAASIDDAERLTRLLSSVQSEIWHARAEAVHRSTNGRPTRAHRYDHHSNSRARTRLHHQGRNV